MHLVTDADMQGRLEAYFTNVGAALGNKKRRASFALYAMGLLGDGERKSIEPIAARCCPDPARTEAMHQQLHHFVAEAEWDDREVRKVAAWHAIRAMEAHGDPVEAWIIDDTGFLKQGKHSVGVQRQYTGSAGKITNCQIGVSLTVATRSAHVPIDFELYLPKDWASDPERRRVARIPEEVTFKTKLDLALQMIERAAREKVPGTILLADGDYGKDPQFRATVSMHGFDYALGVHSTTRVWLLDAAGSRCGPALTASDVAKAIGPKAARRVTWRDGTARKMHARFAFRRVKVAQDDGLEPVKREEQWLIIEWPKDSTEKLKFYLTTLPHRMSKRRIIRLLKERYRTERAYQEMKTELGLDHFEGRSFQGWHHHVSVALCCYAFVVAERLQHFPPSEGQPARAYDPPLRLAA